MKKICILLCFLLIFTLVSCGDSSEKERILPEASNDKIFTVLDDTETPAAETEASKNESTDKQGQTVAESPEKEEPAPSPAKSEAVTENTPAEKEQKSETAPEPASIPEPPPEAKTEEPSPEPEASALTCTLEIRCDSALKSPALSDEKRAYLPADGIILAECEVSFDDGDSAFDILLREAQARKIHFEFSKTPAYNSAYVEGIANLYEFDCGDLSGWNYVVNGSLLRVGCSQYKVKPGDSIVWTYVCDYTSPDEEQK